MRSSLISKIEKARIYAGERERVSITSLAGSFRGNHNEYQVSFDGGTWGLYLLILRVQLLVQPHHGHETHSGGNASEGC